MDSADDSSTLRCQILQDLHYVFCRGTVQPYFVLVVSASVVGESSRTYPK